MLKRLEYQKGQIWPHYYFLQYYFIIKNCDSYSRRRVEHVAQHEALRGDWWRGVLLDLWDYGLTRGYAEGVRCRLWHLHPGPFGQFEHQLQPSRRPQVDTRPIQLVRIQNGRPLLLQIQSFRHIPDFHGSTCQLKPVQLLQRFLSVFAIMELRAKPNEKIVPNERKNELTAINP